MLCYHSLTHRLWYGKKGGTHYLTFFVHKNVFDFAKFGALIFGLLRNILVPVLFCLSIMLNIKIVNKIYICMYVRVCICNQ